MLYRNKVNGKDIYIEDIILKLLNVKIITDANEEMHYEFISIILYVSIAITKKLTS